MLRTHSPFTTWEEAVTKLSVYTINMSIKVYALNKTVTVGDKTEFKVIVTNTGGYDLTGVYIIEKSADDMVFDSWKSVKGDWIYTFKNGVHKWVLKGSLAPNETASFILVFNTTSVGNKTLLVIGGSNEIDGFSAENVTEVINKSNPNHNPIKKGIPMEPTGNPLIALLMALITLPILRRK